MRKYFTAMLMWNSVPPPVFYLLTYCLRRMISEVTDTIAKLNLFPYLLAHIQGGQKCGTYFSYALTLSNIEQFSDAFHC